MKNFSIDNWIGDSYNLAAEGMLKDIPKSTQKTSSTKTYANLYTNWQHDRLGLWQFKDHVHKHFVVWYISAVT